MFSSWIIQIISVGTKWNGQTMSWSSQAMLWRLQYRNSNLFRYSSPDIDVIGWRLDSILTLDNAFKEVISAINNVKHTMINNYITYTVNNRKNNILGGLGACYIIMLVSDDP